MHITKILVTGSYLRACGPPDNKIQSQAELPTWSLAGRLRVASRAGAGLALEKENRIGVPVGMAALIQAKSVLLPEKGEADKW